MNNYNGNSSKFIDTLPDPNIVPDFNGQIATDPTKVPEIEQEIINGFKDEIALRYAQFIRGKMYGADVRESIARFGLWLDVKVNSIETRSNQIYLEYLDIQKELETFREEFEQVISAQTIDGEVKLARMSEAMNKTFPSLKARLDAMERKFYIESRNTMSLTRTLVDNNFSKNHQVRKIKKVMIKDKNYPIIIAEIDNSNQNRFKIRRVG